MRIKRTHALVLVLVLLVGFAYSNGLENPFEFDDWHVIPRNPEVRGPADIPEFFVDVSKFSILQGNRDYRPLFLTSLALSWWVGGGSTVPFHLVSMALHLGNALLLFFILKLFFFSDAPMGRDSAKSHGEWFAFLAAALFAVHPVASEAVLYISSQSVPMAAFFYLLAFFLFLGVYSEGKAPGALGKSLLCSGSYSAYFLALLSKPIAITLPLVLLAWEWLLGSPPEGEGWRQRLAWSRLRKHVPYALVTIVFLVLRSAVAGNPVKGVSVVRKSSYDFALHFLTQTKALVLYYLRLSIAPVRQNVDIEFPVVTSILDKGALLSLFVVAFVIWLLFRFRRQRAVVFWTLWFPICLLVTTYIIPLGQTVREARVYLSLVGFCALAALLVSKLWHRLPLEISDTTFGPRSSKRVIGAVFAAVLLVFSLTTRGRSEIWSSELELWGEAARNGGTWRAHMNYALALDNAGRAEEALSEFKKAVELGPYAWAHLNLGLAYIRRNDSEQGLSHLQTAVRLWPSSPDTHYYLGRGLDSTGDQKGAEAEYLRAIELRDNDVMAHRSLAGLYERQGRRAEALASYRRLFELEPAKKQYENKIRSLEQGDDLAMVNALFEQAFGAQGEGDRAKAIELYERLLVLAPDHRQGTFNLAYAYRDGTTTDDWQRSAELFARVLEIDPGYTEALFHLASVNWKLERTDEAIKYDRLYVERGSHEDLKKLSLGRLEGASGRN